jgi:hypothetical protein
MGLGFGIRDPRSGIRDPEKNLFRIPDPGPVSKRHRIPDPGSGSATLLVVVCDRTDLPDWENDFEQRAQL